MISKTDLKNKAISLRKEGRTYSEILVMVPVAKSTLSLWLRNVGLAKAQKQRLTLKKIQAGLRGGEARKQQRIESQEKIFFQAHKDISKISKIELWLIGIALYWAEGSKEKEYYPGSRIQFGNSDPRMIQVFLRWLKDILGIPLDKIGIDIYIHKNSKNSIVEVKKYWSEVTGFPESRLTNIYFKKHKIKTNRRNTGRLYYGGLRVTVKASSTLVRQIAGWTEAIVKHSK